MLSGAQMFQQLCGINTAMYYSPKILQMSGFHENREAILFADAVAFANALFTALAIWLVERVGRRKLLLGTLPGVVLSLIGLGLSFRETDDGTASGPLVALTCLVFYVIFFAPGLGVIPWCVNAEIYPLSVRATAACIATAVNWISNFIVSVTFLSYVELVGADGAFLTYAAIGVVAWCFFYFMLPETQGLTIEEIQQTFRQGREQPASSEPAAGPSEK
jgi:SP family myo-inositol transporter-like MFS transporter 13